MPATQNTAVPPYPDRQQAVAREPAVDPLRARHEAPVGAPPRAVPRRPAAGELSVRSCAQLSQIPLGFRPSCRAAPPRLAPARSLRQGAGRAGGGPPIGACGIPLALAPWAVAAARPRHQHHSVGVALLCWCHAQLPRWLPGMGGAGGRRRRRCGPVQHHRRGVGPPQPPVRGRGAAPHARLDVRVVDGGAVAASARRGGGRASPCVCVCRRLRNPAAAPPAVLPAQRTGAGYPEARLRE
jgi:hypothetical protein